MHVGVAFTAALMLILPVLLFPLLQQVISHVQLQFSTAPAGGFTCATAIRGIASAIALLQVRSSLTGWITRQEEGQRRMVEHLIHLQKLLEVTVKGGP